jgi:hypothetical protein
MGKQTTIPEDMKLVHPHAAGLDIGAEEIWACVPPSSTAQPVQRFGTFTPDLRSLADWLLNHQVDIRWQWRALACIGFQCLRCWKQRA